VFVSLYEKFHDQGFLVLGISREDRTTLVNYKAENKIPYPILLDDQEVSKTYGVTAIPSIFILDKKGVVRKTQVGFSPELEAEFDSFILTLLNE
jgi:peroxiredoxin